MTTMTTDRRRRGRDETDELMGGDEDYEAIIDSLAADETAEDLVEGYDLSAVDTLAIPADDDQAAWERMPRAETPDITEVPPGLDPTEDDDDMFSEEEVFGTEIAGSGESAVPEMTFTEEEVYGADDSAPEMAFSEEEVYGAEPNRNAMSLSTPDTDLDPAIADMDWADEGDHEPYWESGDEPPVGYGAALPEASDGLEEPEAASMAAGAPESLPDPATGQDDGTRQAISEARQLGDPNDPGALQLSMWDDRIQRLEALQRRAGNATVRRVIGRLITSAIAGASRYLGAMGRDGRDRARRPYEQPISRQSAEERRMPGLIAEQGAEWSNRDELRDRTAMEAERLRQRDQAQQLAGAQFQETQATGAARRDEMGSRAARTDATRQREVDEGLPNSDRSIRTREAFRASIATLPEDVQAAFADQLGALDDLSAREIRELASDINRFAQGRLARRDDSRRTRGGGGGGTAPQSVIAATRARVAELQRHNIIDEETGIAIIQGMASPNRRVRTETQTQLQALSSRLPSRPTARMGADGETSTGREIIPGVYSELSGLEDREVVAIRRSFRQYREAVTTLQAVGDIVDRNGGMRALLDPRVRAEIERRFPALRAMITNIQRTGIIQISEMPLINASLPDPTSVTQQTFQTWRRNLQSWIDQNNEMAIGTMEDYGVDPEGLERTRQVLNARPGQAPRPTGRRPTASRPAQAAPQEGAAPEMVMLRNLETGAEREVSRSTWESAPEEQRSRYEEVR